MKRVTFGWILKRIFWIVGFSGTCIQVISNVRKYAKKSSSLTQRKAYFGNFEKIKIFARKAEKLNPLKASYEMLVNFNFLR